MAAVELAQDVFDELPIGVFVVDADSKIRRWNHWLQDKTALSTDQVLGKMLNELFPDVNTARFTWAVEQVTRNYSPQILSQALNRFIIPVPVSDGGSHGISMMQQHVHIAPVRVDSAETLAVVSIIDVTENVIRSSTLTEMAQKLEHDSNHDALTGVYNRRFMWEWMIPELKQCVRYQHSLACLLLDIDHFKRLNDKFGHDMGDIVLKEFSDIVGIVLRDSDFLVRYGGEEFIVILPHCDLENAVVVATRILNKVRDSAIGGMGKGEVLCSIGAACFSPDNPRTGKELLKEADMRLYKAKTSGRNRVVPALTTHACATPEIS